MGRRDRARGIDERRRGRPGGRRPGSGGGRRSAGRPGRRNAGRPGHRPGRAGANRIGGRRRPARAPGDESQGEQSSGERPSRRENGAHRSDRHHSLPAHNELRVISVCPARVPDLGRRNADRPAGAPCRFSLPTSARELHSPGPRLSPGLGPMPDRPHRVDLKLTVGSILLRRVTARRGVRVNRGLGGCSAAHRDITLSFTRPPSRRSPCRGQGQRKGPRGGVPHRP